MSDEWIDPCSCCCDEPVEPVKRKCLCTHVPDPQYVTPYVPKCCPPKPNTDPRRTTNPYCPPVISRSEPLSHSEYLRRLKANGSKSLSTPSSLVQYGDGAYRKTIWTESGSAGACCATNKALPEVPAVHRGGTALDAGFLTEQKGAYAARGAVSQYDSVNRTEYVHTLKKKGIAISADSSFNAPAGGVRETCANCDFSGTTFPPQPPCCA